MGDYGAVTAVENFLEDKNHMRTSTNDLAQVGDARLVVTGEPDKNAVLSASWIKRLVGGDSVFLRKNYGQGETRKRPWKIVIHCNDVPRLPSNDPAVNGRLRILPGGKTVPPSAQVHDLKERLRDEYPAILRWMLDGAALWAKEGLGAVPGAAVAAANEYFEEQDSFIAWMAERIEIDAAGWESTKALFSDFEAWCRGNDRMALAVGAFGKRLTGHQWEVIDPRGRRGRMARFEAKRGATGDRAQGFAGLKLKPKSPDAPSPHAADWPKSGGNPGGTDEVPLW
jgi:putative DNA primase/helicase